MLIKLILAFILLASPVFVACDSDSCSQPVQTAMLMGIVGGGGAVSLTCNPTPFYNSFNPSLGGLK